MARRDRALAEADGVGASRAGGAAKCDEGNEEAGVAAQGADEGRHAARRLGCDPARAWPGSASTTSAAGCRRAKLDANWSVESLTRLRERVESFGLTLDMVPLPLSSSEISRSENPSIMLGKAPERDRQIDDICQMIRNTGEAGIPSVEVQPDVPRRTAHGADARPRRRRATARSSTTSAQAGSAADRGGPVDADPYWERITYFLERVVPVAEEYKVRLACHPQDPGDAEGARAIAASRPSSARSTA